MKQIRDKDFLKNLFKKNLKAYLLGNVIILAQNENEVKQTLEAISLPPNLPLQKLKEVWERKPAIHTKINKDTIIELADIPTSEQAIILANKIASELEKYSPFIVRRIECTITYRASEDGGYTIKNNIKIIIRNINPSLTNHLINLIQKLAQG